MAKATDFWIDASELHGDGDASWDQSIQDQPVKPFGPVVLDLLVVAGAVIFALIYVWMGAAMLLRDLRDIWRS